MSVNPQKEQALRDKMKALGIYERDITENFIRSSGKGGQNVNKTASCVFLLHRPTGIIVKCQQERSQALNRFLARRLLAEKYERMILGIKTEAEKLRQKIRRQKRRRSRRSQEKRLAEKKHHARKMNDRKFQPDRDL